MTIKQEYFAYLEHFGRTMTIGELAAHPDWPDAIALRHDIDHDLDLALEIAHHEHVRGIRATYFLLHSHQYFDDPQFTIKCRQLAEYGHEVGVHLNALAMWAEGLTDDPDETLSVALERLRESGLEIHGASAHGDKACYRHQCINYWMFSELAGPRPEEREFGKSAEGIRVESAQHQIQYPHDHQLRRADGAVLPLWQSSLARHGLEYTASHVPHDWYWTDTGGGWTRSADPKLYDLSRGRHQVLMHPFWWRGPQKSYFVLSTARSGSKWLANFIDRATNCRGLHEWTLNHRRDGKGFALEHCTGPEYQSLLEDEDEISARLKTAKAHLTVLKRDVLEANVYLEPVAEQLRETIPDAMLVHLHRDPANVVRSILNRGWYSVPDDQWHVRVPVDDWNTLSQFQRACWYVRRTNERLTALTAERLCFERMVSDQDYLMQRLSELGIVVHPLLAAEEFHKRINANESSRIGALATWASTAQSQFAEICGTVCESLGYQVERSSDVPSQAARTSLNGHHSARARKTRLVGGAASAFSECGLECKRQWRGLDIQILDRQRSSHVLLAKGSWRKVERKHGVPCEPATYCWGEVRCESPERGNLRIFILFYDMRGDLLQQRHVGTLRMNKEIAGMRATLVGKLLSDSNEEALRTGTSQFSVRVPAGATHLALSLMCDAGEIGEEFAVREAVVELRPLPAGYAVEEFV
ncbi:MAG TPA: sulfotransferase [Phycisphaerales bacterium]|nr:sulfotransferase [Phycisphaerales bacterium]